MPKVLAPPPPSRDEMRALRREMRREGTKASLSLRRSSRDRLNRLKRHYGLEDQGQVIDMVYSRAMGMMELTETT